MKRFVTSVVLGLALVACTPEPEPGPKVGLPEMGVPGGGCLEQGGTIVTGMGGPTCVLPTPDAGKSCQKASDCSEACLGKTMTCAPQTPYFGCYEVVVEAGQKAMLCVD